MQSTRTADGAGTACIYAGIVLNGYLRVTPNEATIISAAGGPQVNERPESSFGRLTRVQ